MPPSRYRSIRNRQASPFLTNISRAVIPARRNCHLSTFASTAFFPRITSSVISFSIPVMEKMRISLASFMPLVP